MKRGLAVFTCSFAVGVLLALLILPVNVWLYVSLGAALVATLLLLSRRKSVVLIAFFCLAVAVALLWCAVYYHAKIEPLINLVDYEGIIQGTVIEAPVKSEYGSSVMLRVDPEGYGSVKARLFIFGHDISDIECGTDIQVKAEVTCTLSHEYVGTLSSAAKGCFLSCTASDTVEVVGRSDKWAFYFPGRLAKALKERIALVLPDDTVGFVTALITGDTTLLEKDTVLVKALSSSGIYHICSVSGLHVMFLASVIIRLCPSKKLGAFITMIIVAVFAAVVGFPSSVIRAAFMLFASLIAPLIYRETDSLTSLSGVLMILLIINPWSLFSVGLQLSFAATLGIILISARITSGIKRLFRINNIGNKWVYKIVNYEATVFGTTVGATVFTIPISAYWFGYFSLAAPLTNLLVMPLVNTVFYLSGAACAVSAVFMPAGKVLGSVAAVFIRIICWLAKLIGRSPVSVVYTTNAVVIIWLILVYLAIILLFVFKGSAGQAFVAATAAAAAFAVISTATTQLNSGSGLTIDILDVGQGQCIVLRDGGLTAVVDCGSNSIYDAGDVACAHIKGYGESCIDLMIYTHFDTDHTDGSSELFSKFNMGIVAMAEEGASAGDKRGEIVELAEAYDADIAIISAVSTVEFGSSTITIFPPVSPGIGNSGIVVLVSSGTFDVLITGDISSADEKRMLSTYDLPDIELLIVGHHGSYYSTAPELLDELCPEIAVISVGENSYGHPNTDVLDRLNLRKIKIYRTDLDGTVSVSAEEG